MRLDFFSLLCARKAEELVLARVLVTLRRCAASRAAHDNLWPRDKHHAPGEQPIPSYLQGGQVETGAVTSSESVPSTLTARRAHLSTTPNQGAYLGCGLHTPHTVTNHRHRTVCWGSEAQADNQRLHLPTRLGMWLEKAAAVSPCRHLAREAGGRGTHWVSRYQATSVRMEM